MAAELGIKPVYLSGHLHALWHTALEQQEDGDLSKWPANLIAQMAMFDGDPDHFVSLLKRHNWIDEDTMLLHDWLEYAGEYLIWKYARRHRRLLVSIWAKYGKRYGKRTGQIHVKVQRMSNTTNPVVGLVGKDSSSSLNSSPERFERFWAEYPNKTAKGAAKKAWEKAKITAPVFETILSALETQKQSDRWTRDNGQYIPNPATWINQTRWLDEPSGADIYAKKGRTPEQILADLEAKKKAGGSHA